MEKKYILECCVDSVESAINAQKGGANRLELCANLIIGGTTPTLSLFYAVKKVCTIPIHILIRPRFGDFLYTTYEKEIIEKEIEQFEQAKADGVVIGCLKKDGQLDQETMKRWIEKAKGMSITLHRAFDVCSNPFQALEEAKQLGIHTILTSGQRNTSLEGEERLKELSKQADNIDIMAGSGINSKVISYLLEQTTITSYHMSGKITLNSQMQYRNPDVFMGLDGLSEYEIYRTDSAEIASARKILDDFFNRG